MDVETDAYVEANVDVYIDVCGIWLLWLEQGLEDINLAGGEYTAVPVDDIE